MTSKSKLLQERALKFTKVSIESVKIHLLSKHYPQGENYDQQLIKIHNLLNTYLESVNKGLPMETKILSNTGKHIVDSWPKNYVLGSQILEAENYIKKYFNLLLQN